MKTLLITGFLLDEYIEEDNPPVEDRGEGTLKEGFICLLKQAQDDSFSGFMVDVGANLYYNITEVTLFSPDAIRFLASATKGVVIPFEKVDLKKSKPGEIVYTGEVNKDPMTESVEVHITSSEKGGFWKGLRWNMILGYMKQQCSCIVTELPEGFFSIRPEDTQKASMARAFDFVHRIMH